MLKIKNDRIIGTIENDDKELFCMHCGERIRTDKFFIRQLFTNSESIVIITCDKLECFHEYQSTTGGTRPEVFSPNLYKKRAFNLLREIF